MPRPGSLGARLDRLVRGGVNSLGGMTSHVARDGALRVFASGGGVLQVGRASREQAARGACV